MSESEVRVVKASRIAGGYMLTVGDQSEPLIREPDQEGFIHEAARVAEALGIRGAEVYLAIERCTDDVVNEILCSPRPLDPIGRILDDAIAGEDGNKKALFVLLLSAKGLDPAYKEMVLFKSSSGGGKSTVANIMTQAYRTKKVGRLSRTALDYTDLKDYQVLYMQELGQMDSEEYGTATVKFLSSEDEGYTIEITVRDPDTGAMTTMQRQIPPLTVVSTTTRVSIDSQYERRNWIMSVDETPEQTERIRQLNARHEREKLEVDLGLRSETSRDRADRLMRALVEAVKPVKVGILYPDALMGVLKSEKLRVRGDFKKLTRLLTYYTWLRQRTLPSLEVNGELIVFPTPEAAVEILQAAVGPLTFMTMDIEGRDLKLLRGFEDLAIKRQGDVITPDLRDELRLKLGYSKDTIAKYLNNLVDRGFLTDNDEKPKSYWLVHSLESIKRDLNSVEDAMANPEALKLAMVREATETLGALTQRMPELAQLANSFTYTPTPGTRSPYPDSQQSPNNPEKPEIRPNQPDSSRIRNNQAQNAIRITPPPAQLKLPEKHREAAARWPDPDKGPLFRDMNQLLQTVWNHQEEQQRGPIDEEDLRLRLGWDLEHFIKIRDSCLTDGTIFRNPFGRVGIEW